MAQHDVPADVCADPLRSHIPAPFSEIFYPLGFPLRLDSTSPAVLGAARHIWGRYLQSHDCEPLHLRFNIDEASSAPRPDPVLPRLQGHLFSIVHSTDNVAVADLSKGFAAAWLTPSVLAEPAHFRYHFLEPLTYAILVERYLTPVHAACISLDDSGILLCGDSGSGKTSLAYACAKAGWTYVSDDATYVVRNSAVGRVIGKPHFARFRSSAIDVFPELTAFPSGWRPSGNPDIEISTHDLGLTRISLDATPAFLVFLNRRSYGPAVLGGYSRAKALEWLDQVVYSPQQAVREAQRESLRTVLRGPVFELTYSGLYDAERVLKSLIRTEV